MTDREEREQWDKCIRATEREWLKRGDVRSAELHGDMIRGKHIWEASNDRKGE